MVDGEGRGTAAIHVPEKPRTVHFAESACEECGGCDKPCWQIEVADIVAFLVEESLVAMDVDLNLERRHERKSGMDE